MATNRHSQNSAADWLPPNPSQSPSKRYWEVITDIMETVPQAEWENIPHDGSINYRHYLYGHAKVQPGKTVE